MRRSSAIPGPLLRKCLLRKLLIWLLASSESIQQQKSWRLFGRDPILMFEMRTDFRNASLTSSFVTRPHHSNLYSRIERFGRFLRASHAPAGTSPLRGCVVRIAVVNCARRLRPQIAPVDCARRQIAFAVGLGNVRGQVLAKRVSITRLRILLIAAQPCAWLCGAGTSAYQLI